MLRTFSPREAARDRVGWGASLQAVVEKIGLDSAAQRRFAALLEELHAHDVDSLCVRAASAAFVRDSLGGRHGLLARLGDAAEHARCALPMEHFAAARSCLDEAFEHVCDYISVKVVFGDLRASLLLGLYAPSPHAARISAPLRTLDGTLGALHTTPPPPLD